MSSQLQVPKVLQVSESRRSSISNASDRSNKNVSFDDQVVLRTFQASSSIPLTREESFELVAQLDVPVRDISKLVPYKKSLGRSKSLSAAFRKLLPKKTHKPKRHSVVITLG